MTRITLSLSLPLSLPLSLLALACAPADGDRAGVDDAAAAATPAVAAAGSGLPRGEYQCLDTYVEVGAPMKVTYKELLIIEDDDSYRFRKDGPAGAYAYDAASGAVRWLSGPYAGGNPVGSFTRREDGREIITLTYTFEKLGTDEDFCFRKQESA
jgi:hypothetical protein